MTHFVYEFWSGRTCLYVGCTGDFSRRLGEHQRLGYTVRGVERIVLRHASSRDRALALESDRIFTLRPQFNVRGNPRVEVEPPPGPAAIYNRSLRQVDLDCAFLAETSGPTPGFSPRERKWAVMQLVGAKRRTARLEAGVA